MAKQRDRGAGSLYKRNGKGCWIACWFDRDGRRKQRTTKTTDRATALRILGKRTADVALRRGGVIDPREDAYAEAERRPILEHLEDFRRDLENRGNTSGHCEER